MYNIIKKLVMSFGCLFFWHSHAIIVGSTTAVSVQAATTFPSGDNTNTMLGFAQFNGGFVLTDTGTRCLYNTYFPIAGILNMRGGLLNLAVDMNIKNVTSFASTGTFNGNNFPIVTPKVPLASSPFIIPMNTPNVTVFNSRFAQPAGLLNNSSVDWSAGDQYCAVANQVAPIVSILQFNQSTYAITQVATANPSGLGQAVRWHPTLLYLAVSTNSTAANSALIYQFTPPSTLTQLSGVTTSFASYANAWHPSGNYVAFGFSNGVIVYSVNQSTGALTQISSALPGRVSNNALSWSSDGKYLVAGYTTSSTNQLIVYSFNGSTITQVATNTPGVNVTGAEWNSVADFIAVGLASGANTVSVFQFNRSTNTLTRLTNSLVGQTNLVNGMSWSPDGQSLLACFATAGVTPFQIYNFNPYSFVLSLVSAPNKVSGNGVLAVRWSDGGLYAMVGEANTTFTSFYTVSVPYSMINFKMVMNSDVVMYGLPIFRGNCMIYGNGYTLDISKSQSFTIGSGATLLLKDVNVYGVSGNGLTTDGTPANRPNFADSTGVLKLEDMIWTQTGDYTLVNGAFTIQGDVLFTGTSNFIYSSGKTSIINANSQLMFDNSTTFSYAPPISSQNLLQMIDQTSQLYFNNTSLFVSSVGCQLTNGSWFINGQCNITSFGTSQLNGLRIGDGISSVNNLTLKILPESGLAIQSGFCAYQNI
ncbi:MAG: beta-propeller fold lactonase family protein [Candidatus Dependentiae bacterium]|nr:beta-propeller fold lactonase family protein [Candidatus Dependentiae bacterium]